MTELPLGPCCRQSRDARHQGGGIAFGLDEIKMLEKPETTQLYVYQIETIDFLNFLFLLS
jgi:hypothetical protein